MKIYKLFAIVAVLCITFSAVFTLAGCRNKENTSIPRVTKSAEEQERIKREQKEAEQTSYQTLIQIHEQCTTAAIALVNAYSFATETKTEYKTDADCLTAFCMVTRLDKQVVSDATDAVLEELQLDRKPLTALLQDGNTAVAIARQALTANGTYSSIEQRIDQAAEALKTLSSDFDGYFPMRGYYFDLIEYATYCATPTGSYQDLDAAVREYESTLAGMRYKLEQFME